MGGSGGGFRSNFKPNDYFDRLKNSTSEEQRQSYEQEVADFFGKLLGRFNGRDTEVINRHVDEIISVLEKELDEGNLKTNFGGSLSRNTHLNGLSDVDVLVILNDTELAKLSPPELLKFFRDRIKGRYPNHEIDMGDTAVTVRFSDGDIQLLPAIKYKSGIKIPDGNKWSDIVAPKQFSKSITELNQSLSGALVPTIKLAKAILSKLPEANRLSGYHIESLALDIFTRKPPKSLTYKDMLKDFFTEASERVKKPIKDETGQSDNIDDYLGGKGSLPRTIVANYLTRIANKIDYSDKTCEQSNWEEILDI